MSLKFRFVDDQPDVDRLMRFRQLLARYCSVWGFAPPRARFVWLWQMSVAEDTTQAELERLDGA